MSKSLGNIFQLSEAIDRFGRRRSSRSWAPATTASRSSSPRRRSSRPARVERVRNFLADAPEGGDPDPFVAERREAFLAALADDFNTPRAWAELFD